MYAREIKSAGFDATDGAAAAARRRFRATARSKRGRSLEYRRRQERSSRSPTAPNGSHYRAAISEPAGSCTTLGSANARRTVNAKADRVALAVHGDDGSIPPPHVRQRLLGCTTHRAHDASCNPTLHGSAASRQPSWKIGHA